MNSYSGYSGLAPIMNRGSDREEEREYERERRYRNSEKFRREMEEANGREYDTEGYSTGPYD